MTAADYDAWYDTPRGRWIGTTEYRLLRAALDLRPGERVLDVGCGTGWFTRQLAGDGADVTGLDVDREALQFAREHAAAGEQYIEGDARRLPFAAHAFDCTVSVAALCFVDPWPQAIAEIMRVSRRRFVLGLLNRHSLLWLHAGREGGRGSYAGAHWHTRGEVEAALAGSMLQHVSFCYGIFSASGTPLARAAERLLPAWIPFGAFMVVRGEVARSAD